MRSVEIMGTSSRSQRRATAAAGIALGLAVTLGACGSGEAQPHKTITVSAPASGNGGETAPIPQPSSTQRVGRVTLSDANMCAWSPSNPQPLVSRHPLEAQIDGRCAMPLGDNYIGGYSQPQQKQTDRKAFRLEGPQVVDLICETSGEEITDGAAVYGYPVTISDQWEIVKASNGMIREVPAFGLGYPQGVPACTSDQLKLAADSQ